jgi:hypothetical protein
MTTAGVTEILFGICKLKISKSYSYSHSDVSILSFICKGEHELNQSQRLLSVKQNVRMITASFKTLYMTFGEAEENASLIVQHQAGVQFMTLEANI